MLPYGAAMEFSLIIHRLWRLRLLVALGILVAAAAAILSVAHVTFSPFKIKPRSDRYGAAQANFYLDTRSHDLSTTQVDTTSLTSRAQTFARFMNSGAVRDAVARDLGIRTNALVVMGPNPDTPGQTSLEPAAQQRANQLLGRGSAYSVLIDTEQAAPTVTLFTQAPNGAQAGLLAQSMIAELGHYVQRLQRGARPAQLRSLADQLKIAGARQSGPVSSAQRRQAERKILSSAPVIRALGPPISGDVTDQTSKAAAVGAFVGVLIVWCVILLLLSGLVNVIRHRR